MLVAQHEPSTQGRIVIYNNARVNLTSFACAETINLMSLIIAYKREFSMQIVTRWCSFLAVVFISSFANASDGEAVLVEHIPLGADNWQATNIVKQAFLGRKWIIISTDTESVIAEHAVSEVYNAKIKVYRSGQSLHYTDLSTRYDSPFDSVANTSFDETHSRIRPSTAPKRWINNLRLDISKQFAILPDSPQIAIVNENPVTAIERLKVLKEMLDAGLITNEDFEQGKRHILQGL